jgi:hypothetical protein
VEASSDGESLDFFINLFVPSPEFSSIPARARNHWPTLKIARRHMRFK